MLLANRNAEIVVIHLYVTTLLHVCLFSYSMMYISRYHNLSGKCIKQKPYFILLDLYVLPTFVYCFLQKVVR